MRCPYCGTENRPEARFCSRCGASLTAWSAPPAGPSFGPSPAPSGPAIGPTPPPSWTPPPPEPEAYPPYPSYAATPPASARTNTLAIVSLVLALLAFPAMACYGAGFLLGIAALVIGLVARSQIARSGGLQKGSGLALAGAIIGPLVIVLWLCVIVTVLLGPQISQVFSRITSSLSVP